MISHGKLSDTAMLDNIGGKMQEERKEQDFGESTPEKCDKVRDIAENNTEAKEPNTECDSDLSGNIGDNDSDKEESESADDFTNTEEPEAEDAYEKSEKLATGLKVTAVMSVTLAVFAAVMRVCLANEPLAGEVFYRYISRFLQAGMAKLTSFIPFSLAETVLIMLPLVCIVVFAAVIHSAVRRQAAKLARLVLCIFTVVCLVASNYILNLSMLYCRPSLSLLCGISDKDVTADELCASTLYMTYRLSELTQSGDISFDTRGASVSPYGFEELEAKIDDAFDKYAEKNSWVSPYGAKAKIIAFSDYMTYTHISGIYTQFTGEANINVNYPDFIVCSTIAHEKAHQRGIAPEDEANLVAMFVLCESEDPYLEYCGYMSVFDSLARDCRAADSEFYGGVILQCLPMEVVGELTAYSEFFEKYQDNKASKVATSANDAYLKLNGESEGVVSYDMVSGMAARYILQQADARFSVSATD